MAHNYGYLYPPYYYIPEPWRTTYVPRHFPEKHYPLEHFRHAVANTVHSVANPFVHPFGSDPVLRSPLADIRETSKSFYVDVELPGLETKDDLKIRWTSGRVLLIETKTTRPELDEVETNDKKDSAIGEPLTRVDTRDEEPKQGESGDSKTDDKSQAKGNTVALTLHERRIGFCARAFSFPTEVIHENLEATLHAGLLRLKVLKKETDEVHPDHKHVDVKHSGA